MYPIPCSTHATLHFGAAYCYMYNHVVITSTYIEDITRWREDRNFMLEWQQQYLTSERSERVRYCSCRTYTKHGPGSMDHHMDLVHGPRSMFCICPVLATRT